MCGASSLLCPRRGFSVRVQDASPDFACCGVDLPRAFLCMVFLLIGSVLGEVLGEIRLLYPGDLDARECLNLVAEGVENADGELPLLLEQSAHLLE